MLDVTRHLGHRKIDKISVDVFETKEAVRSSSNMNIANGIMKILTEAAKNASWNRSVETFQEELKGSKRQQTRKSEPDSRESARKNETASSQKSYVGSCTSDDIAQSLKLDINIEMHLEDVDMAYTDGLEEGALSRRCLRWLGTNPDFLGWYRAETSGTILIQENRELSHVSAVSSLMSLLYAQFEKDKTVLVLPFFCGLHSGRHFQGSEEIEAPVVLARALLAQLLRLREFDWTKVMLGQAELPPQLKEMNKLQSGNFGSYMKLIKNLIEALRTHFSAIFVLLDHIDEGFRPKHVKRLAKTLRKLTNPTEPSRSGGVVKVLFSAATHTEEISKDDDDDIVVLEVPDEIDGEDEVLEVSDLDR
ncbi:hypothetical protein CC80DRAFT_174883 [Byssothecium circinans]|uniref:Uncharacterized protein n=1 Tax=Byssothecium circinans TaxID=147558 RepID=A0A6A5TL84_9PLEO|nr:hypothetical protein CC80DRAFT_174883 [Byssothecium circinans]